MYAVLVAQSCQTLCNPTDSSLPGSSVHAISQARILEWVAIPFSQDSFSPGINSGSLALQADASLSEPLWWWCSVTKSCPTFCLPVNYSMPGFSVLHYFPRFAQNHVMMPSSHLILCHPMDYSLPGSWFHGILQARILEWVAIPFSRESS